MGPPKKFPFCDLVAAFEVECAGGSATPGGSTEVVIVALPMTSGASGYTKATFAILDLDVVAGDVVCGDYGAIDLKFRRRDVIPSKCA